MAYNTGNYEKHTTRNPLKRYLVNRLNSQILISVRESVRKNQRKKGQTIRILDAGCGEGFISNLLIDELGNERIEIVGLELNAEAIRIAKTKNPKMSFVQGDICKMPFETEAFDIVICTEVLEHLQSPEAALSELIRVSRQAIIVTVPHEPWFCMGNLLVLKNITRLGNPIDHINHWTFLGFKSFLLEHSKVKWKMGKSFPWTIAQCAINNEKSHSKNTKK